MKYFMAKDNIIRLNFVLKKKFSEFVFVRILNIGWQKSTLQRLLYRRVLQKKPEIMLILKMA